MAAGVALPKTVRMLHKMCGDDSEDELAPVPAAAGRPPAGPRPFQREGSQSMQQASGLREGSLPQEIFAPPPGMNEACGFSEKTSPGARYSGSPDGGGSRCGGDGDSTRGGRAGSLPPRQLAGSRENSVSHQTGPSQSLGNARCV